MKAALKHLGGVLTGLFAVAAVGFGIYWFFAAVVDKLDSVDSDISKTLITAFFALLGATVTLVAGKVLEQKQRIKQEVRLKKVPVYEEQIKVIFDVVFATARKKQNFSQDKLIRAFTDFTEKLIIWGDSDVIKKWQEFRLHDWGAGADQNGVEGFRKFEQFVKALRRDLGNDNRKLKDGELLKLFINDFEEYASKSKQS